MTELHKEIIRTGVAGNPMTAEESKIVLRYLEVATKNGTTYLAPLPIFIQICFHFDSRFSTVDVESFSHFVIHKIYW